MKKKFVHIIHIVIAVAAAANLAAVVLFGYGLSSRTPAVIAAERAASERAEKNLADGGANTQTPSSEETAPEADSFAESTSEASESTPQESSSAPAAETASSSTAAENYTGPEILVTNNLPALRVSELPNCVQVLHDLSQLSATDGSGNDISSQIQCSYKAVDESLVAFLLTFTVTNSRGDTATKTATVETLEIDRPYLELTDERVTLHTGDTFQYIRYVNFAVDTNGNRLFDNIELRGTVDTNTAGSYELTYTITSRVTGDRESATLTVVVEG